MAPIISGGGTGSGGLTPFYSTTVSGSSTTTVGPGASTVPGTGTVLVIHLWGQTTAAGVNSANTITFNGDTGSNYDFTNFFGNNAATTSNFTGAQANIPLGYTHGAGGTSTYGGGCVITIPGYASTAFWKTAYIDFTLPEELTANSFSGRATAGWRATTAINQVTITAASGHYVAGTVCVAYTF